MKACPALFLAAAVAAAWACAPAYARQLVTQRPSTGAAAAVIAESGGISNPAWSPRRNEIAYIASPTDAEEQFSLRLVPGSGGPSRTLVAHAGGERIAWSPNGRRIAFVDRRGGVSVVTRRGKGLLRIAPRTHSAEDIAWSPDGQWIAFAAFAHDRCGEESIFVVRPSGRGRARRMTRPPGIAPGCYENIFHDGFPVWAGARTVVFARLHFKSPGDVSHGSELYSVSLANGLTRRVTHGHSRWQIEDLARSPGGRLAVGRARVFPPDPQEGDQFIASTHMWLASSDGTYLRRLRQGDAGSPVWTRSGRRLAFSADGEVYVAGASGRRVRRVTHSGLDAFEVTWSPAARHLAYTRDAPAP
jgi:Tol biopolymer transport system component